MRRALAIEVLKLRHSTVVAVTSALVIVFAPLLSLGFVAAASADGAGAVALKAQAMVVGEGWEAYLGLLAQMVAIALFIGPGVVVAWSFGREHSDRTFASLFALAVSRRSIAAAKFVVLAVWGLALTAGVLAVSVAAGFAADVGPLAGEDLVPSVARLGIAGFLTTLLALTIGYVASAGRGYLPAIGALILLTAVTQVSVLFGTGGWFPYAAPGLYALAGAEGIPSVSPVQLLLVPATVLVVAWFTTRWWERAEAV